MIDWDTICKEGERLANDLVRHKVDLSEAQKFGDYFRFKLWDEEAAAIYLNEMAINPPLRSRRSQTHYKNIRSIWNGWRTELKGSDKARAWGIAIRTAKAKKAGVGW